MVSSNWLNKNRKTINYFLVIVSSTQATGLNKGTLRSKLQNLIKQKERREADRRERHRRRMESDEKLYSILETLINEI